MRGVRLVCGFLAVLGALRAQGQAVASTDAGAASAPVADAGVLLEREALTPYFGSGVRAQAHAAFRARQYPRARALLEGAGDALPVRFLRALAALRGAQPALAGPEFEALAADWPPLADRCLVWSGQAYEALRAWPSALRVYAQVGAASRFAPDARLGRARSHGALGQVSEGLALVETEAQRPPPAWGRDLAAEALVVQAELRTAAHDPAGARAAWVALWSRHPLSRQATLAAARLGERPALTREDLLNRGEALLEGHRNAEAEAVLQPVLARPALPDEGACRVRLALGRAQRKQRAHTRALATLAPVVERCEDADLRARARYLLGLSELAVAPTERAGSLEALAREHPAHALADDALLLAAEQRLRLRDGPGAAALLEALVARFPEGDMASDAWFRLFWLARAAGRFDEGLAVLTRLEARAVALEDLETVGRVRYWRGRTLEAQGTTAEAADVLASLVRDHPATYHGLLAQERLRALDHEGAAALDAASSGGDPVDPFPLQPGPLASEPRFLAAVELTRLGLGELVPAELLAIERDGLPPPALRALVELLSLAGEPRAAHALARLALAGELVGPVSAQRRATWRLGFPFSFREEVLAGASAADGLDPELLQALVREESGLDPRALSPAGALGLCQLMPSTAARISAQLGLPRPTPRQLLEPALNARLGARHLADLLRRFRGVTPLALAAYNAGEGAVARWRREHDEADLAAWVEDIPIPETRGYVKRVLRSYAVYTLLSGRTRAASLVGPVPTPPPPGRRGEVRGSLASPRSTMGIIQD